MTWEDKHLRQERMKESFGIATHRSLEIVLKMIGCFVSLGTTQKYYEVNEEWIICAS